VQWAIIEKLVEEDTAVQQLWTAIIKLFRAARIKLWKVQACCSW
jgi:hypothetical protein